MPQHAVASFLHHGFVCAFTTHRQLFKVCACCILLQAMLAKMQGALAEQRRLQEEAEAEERRKEELAEKAHQAALEQVGTVCKIARSG